MSRNFEEDFETAFNFDNSMRKIRPQDVRIDEHPTVNYPTDYRDDPERKARVLAHQRRVQKEMKRLGIVNNTGRGRQK